ncbi:MAG: glycoside hydrolase family 95 protein [bacterium]
MKDIFLVCIFSLVTVLDLSAQENTLLKLCYNKPANQRVEALPIGNGRLGAMVFGNLSQEKIQLNENTVWADQPNRNDNPEAKEALPQVKKLIFKGRYKEAQDLVNQKFISKISQGMPYQTVGNLYLSFPGQENFINYYRELNIETAVTSIRYEVERVTFKREVFATFPDQIIILRITANKPGEINFTASMNRPTPVEVSTHGNDQLIMSGVTGDCDAVKGAIQFRAQLKIETEGGSISPTDSSLRVKDANSATLYINRLIF